MSRAGRRRGRARSRPKRLPRKRILVVTEGKLTEPDYVQQFVQYYKDDTKGIHIQTLGVGKDPLRVVTEAIKRRNKDEKTNTLWNEIVCLVDVDQHTTLADASQLANAEGITLIVTRLKFETWLLWHVSDSRRAHTSRELDRLMQEKKLLRSGKGIHPNFPFHELERAVRNAKSADRNMASGRVGPDPSSGMPILIDLLRRGGSPNFSG